MRSATAEEAADEVDRVEAWFARHGSKAVFLGRLVPLWRFPGLTLAGSLIWNSVLILAGYFLGEDWPLVEEYAGVLQMLVALAVALSVALFAVGKLRKRRARVGA